MDKYEYKVRSEEIKELIAQKEYVQAAEIADTIDWRRVKSVMMLCTISDLYKINRRYEDSHDLLLLAYDRHPGGRTIVYALCELSIKMGNVTQAWEYYKEYMQIAPKDPGRYILQYKIYEAEEVNLEERIAVLEELKKRDYRERWAYELAYLYHRIGLASKCVDECDEMIVWFGDGKYVIKAMELKMLHQPLTLEQQMKYDSRFAPMVEETTVEAYEQVQEEQVAEATTTWSGAQVAGVEGLSEVEFAATRRVPVEEIDIQVKTMDPGQCNTINLQEEVAAGLRELWEGRPQDAEITRAIIAPMLETDSVDSQAVEDALGEESVHVEEQIAVESTEAEQEEVVQEAYEATEEPEETEVYEIQPEVTEVHEAEVVLEVTETAATEVVAESVEEDVDNTAATVMEQLRRERTAEPPKEMAEVLSMEADGQISFVMPEKEALEKQITGQISIADIMAEWERRKKEIEEKNKEKILQNVKRDTGPMFTEFEAAVRDGLLEQLERGRDPEAVIAEAEGRKLDEDGIPIPPSLLEETLTDSEEEGFVEDYEEITVEEAREAVESVADAVPEEEAEPVVEAAEEAPQEPVIEVTEEALEITEENVQETTEEFFEEEEPQEAVIEALVEAVLSPEDEVEELIEIEDLSDAMEEVEIASESDNAGNDVGVQEEVEGETEFEEVFEETDEQELSEMDAAYEAALVGAKKDDGDEKEAGIEYETISIPTGEVGAAVQQEAVKQRKLTREERELFSPYIQGKESKLQLVQTIDNISMAAYTGNVVITGAEGLDTLGLAKNIIRNIQMTDSNFSGKIAKISGESLNKRDVTYVLEGLDNGALIIQKANTMNSKTVESLYKALQQEEKGIVVILEGTRKAMNAFLDKHEKLKASFTGRIDMQALSDSALVAFGKKYAREKEYTIDELGALALSRKIGERQSSDHAVTIMEVKEIIDAAIESANRKSVGHFFDILMAKRYDDEDMIIIREKDFR
ncbi:MAG: hypothetical protein IJX63_10090 [Lachnospiraceae bacterium]|nr:hypothetical protein [Lachnospiraceae bacterium]